MKPSAKITEFMMLKLYSRTGRSGFNSAIVQLGAEWLERTGESLNLRQKLEINNVSFVTESKDDSAFLMIYPTMSDSTVESFYNENDLVFLDAEPDEIERFCIKKDYIKSDALFIRSDGIAQYQGSAFIRYWTAEFDIVLIHEILKTQTL